MMALEAFTDRFMLGLCVWREARGESFEGKRLVAQVIKNRRLDARWPNSYSGVITQPWQFSSFNPGDPNAALYPKAEDPSWAESLRAVDDVLNGGAFTEANHYHTQDVHPRWANPMMVTERVGRHVFYKL